MTERSSQPRSAFRLDRLKPPRAKYDIAKLLVPAVEPTSGKRLKGFETRQQMRQEAKLRARSVERYARQLRSQGRSTRSREAARLGKLLRRATRAKGFESFANPFFMRQFRRRFFGEVLRVVRSVPLHDVRIYHVVASKWRLQASRLGRLNPAKLRESLRASLLRAGLAALSGWTITFFHNEADRATGDEQPHFHVLVVGEKYRAFEALRALPMFEGGKGKAVYRPIVAQELASPARQISYLFKGYFPETIRYTHERTGGDRRYGRRRLSEPRHAQSILFLHKQRFSDLIWMHGIEIRRGRLVPTGGC